MYVNYLNAGISDNTFVEVTMLWAGRN